MSAEKIWFLNTADGQTGPFSAAEIRSQMDGGQITPEWFVWREGLAEWAMIGTLAEFTEPQAPPPAPSIPPPPAAGAPDQSAAADKTAAGKPSLDAKTTDSKTDAKTGVPNTDDAPLLDPPPAKPKRRLSKGLTITLAVIGIVAVAVGGTMFLAPDVFQVLLQQVGLAAPPPQVVAPPKPQPVQFEPEEEQPSEEEDRAEVLRGYYEILAGRKADYSRTVAVLQQLWADRLAKENDEVRVVTNLEYFGKGKERLGKLDIVLYNEEKDEVEMIAEVKLVSDPAAWVDSAAKELEEFMSALKEKKIKTISEPSTEEGAKPLDWPLKRFGSKIETQKLGGVGYVEAGFDQEFDLTREDGSLLKEWLLGDGPPEAEAAAAEGDDAETDDDGSGDEGQKSGGSAEDDGGGAEGEE